MTCLEDAEKPDKQSLNLFLMHIGDRIREVLKKRGMTGVSSTQERAIGVVMN